MPVFGATSRQRLATCHPDIQRVLNEAIKYVDFSVIEGHRGKEQQNAAYAKGLSKAKYPHSLHNSLPSRAVDIAPYPIDWSDNAKAVERFVYVAGFVMCSARRLGVKIRWGGDWSPDDDMRNEGTFRDYPHFELVT